MWTRKELKDRAKASFKANYWLCVVIALIMTALTAATNEVSTSGSDVDAMSLIGQLSDASGVSVNSLVAMFAGVGAVAIIISSLITVFIKNPLFVGATRFFVVNAGEKANLNELIYSFKDGRFVKTAVTVFLKDLFIALWSCLLVVPGIIAHYSYYMVEYIMADDPTLSYMAAIKKSKEMMKGQKWNTFVLELSFIGWEILNAITCGIVGVFYVQPYLESTKAELYLALKKQA